MMPQEQQQLQTIKGIAPFAIPLTSFDDIYPPRPEMKIHAGLLDKYDTGQFIAQPKLNGSNVLVFLNGNQQIVKNRHDQLKTGKLPDFTSLYRGSGWMCLNGEWMEKSKLDDTGTNFNGNLVLFDILALENHLLIGSTFLSRFKVLNHLYGTKSLVTDRRLLQAEFMHPTDTLNVWRAKTYLNNFASLYKRIVKVDMMEGLVLKKKDTTLAPPFREKANCAGQIKCRKSSTIYSF